MVNVKIKYLWIIRIVFVWRDKEKIYDFIDYYGSIKRLFLWVIFFFFNFIEWNL